MPIETLDFAMPFFGARLVISETKFHLEGRAIVLNVGQSDILVETQSLGPLNSAIMQDIDLRDVESAVLISGFDRRGDNTALFERVRAEWPSAFEVRREDRLRGVGHYMSPRGIAGHLGLTMYFAGSVPLNVGLHREHPFCPVPGFREVHTQIVGFGKMQQCREQDIATLYLEESMAPGSTHRPMYDAEGNYPWHQYETITPSIFLAVEILPECMSFSELEAKDG